MTHSMRSWNNFFSPLFLSVLTGVQMFLWKRHDIVAPVDSFGHQITTWTVVRLHLERPRDYLGCAARFASLTLYDQLLAERNVVLHRQMAQNCSDAAASSTICERLLGGVGVRVLRALLPVAASLRNPQNPWYGVYYQLCMGIGRLGFAWWSSPVLLL